MQISVEDITRPCASAHHVAFASNAATTPVERHRVSAFGYFRSSASAVNHDWFTPQNSSRVISRQESGVPSATNRHKPSDG